MCNQSWASQPRRRAACIVLLAILAGGCHKKPPPPRPPEVQVVTLAPTNVPIFEEWIGTLDGFVNAQIRAQVTGYLLTQDYAEGSQVKKGDLLFEIDPRPFQAALDQARGETGAGPGAVRQDRAGRQALHAAGQGTGDQPGNPR